MPQPLKKTHKKSLGQHFLHEQGVITEILEEVKVRPSETVVEVGPGAGALTKGLLEKTQKNRGELHCIELDHDRIALLQAQFPEAHIHEADAVTYDFPHITEGREWVFVSNLPYNVGTAILMHILTCVHPPRLAVIMVQREVGERMLAVPPRMSLLSIAVQLYANVRRLRVVKPGAFTPPPQVDSIVLVLEPKTHAVNARESIIALARAGFVHPRKFLQNNLINAGYKKEHINQFWRDHALSPTVRAQELSVQDWIDLVSML